MNISPYFLDLRSAYASELDDMRFDSEGRDVLQQRLDVKRKQIAFLLQMIEISPEMVAVAFHQGFNFTAPAVMDHLLSHEAEALPDWDSLAGSFVFAPWAQQLAGVVLKAPGGADFLAITAGLQYMAGRPLPGAGLAAGSDEDDEDEDEDGDDDTDDGGRDGDGHAHPDSDDGAGGERSAREQDEAGANWLADQGFDRKE
ncbi:MAG: hypothetical protein JWQ72_3866 [Polaromonas sp.]|nr:hypothetical protein [Polaromonas sp.]